MITDHWLPILQQEGLLAECPPDQLKAETDWVPLYTKDSLEKHLPAALSTFVNAGLPSLMTVVPPDFHTGTDREFLLTNFHQHGCLGRQSISIVCGGCYSRSFSHGQAMHKHMKSQCCSVTAIRDKTRSSRR